MTTSIRITGLLLSLSLLGFAACRDDSPSPGTTGGAGGATGGRGGTGGTGGRGGTGGTGGSGGRGGTGGTGGSGGGGVDAPADVAGDMAAADGADGSGDTISADAGDAPDAAPVEGGVDTSSDVFVGDVGANVLTFFVSSTGSGAMGGNLGGLAGADAKCEALAAAQGAGGRGWKAFLSSEPGAATAAVNAKDRIGAGPWFNRKGQMISASVAALIATPPAANLMVDEKGNNVPVDWHEVLTGTRADGTAYAGRTCSSWTATTGQSQAGIATDADPTQRFSSHVSGCTQAALELDGNQGRVYCFASTP